MTNRQKLRHSCNIMGQLFKRTKPHIYETVRGTVHLECSLFTVVSCIIYPLVKQQPGIHEVPVLAKPLQFLMNDFI